jgi:hypothetical protein
MLECTSDKKRENAQRSAHVTCASFATSQRPRRPSTWRKTYYRHDNRRQGLRRCQLKFCSSCRTPRPETEFGKFASCVHVGSRHVHGWPPSDWRDLFCNGRPVQMCAVNTNPEGPCGWTFNPLPPLHWAESVMAFAIDVRTPASCRWPLVCCQTSCKLFRHTGAAARSH